MEHIQPNIVQPQQDTSISTQQLDLHNHNEFLANSTEEQIISTEKAIFFTLNNSKKIYDYLDNNTAFIGIPLKYQQSLQQYIDIKNDAEFFKIFDEFIQSKEFKSILKDFIADLKLLKQLIGFYLKEDLAYKRQIRIKKLIKKLKNTAEYMLQNPNNLLEMFSVTRENIHIIVAVISKLKTAHEISNDDTEQIDNSDITADALTELIIEYCDMFDSCWKEVAFKMLSLQQGLKHRLPGKIGIVCKVKHDLLTALSIDTEQQLIVMGDRRNHPKTSVHVIAYLNYQLANKLGIAAIKDVIPNNAKNPRNPKKPTDIQVQEYKKNADIVLSAYNINLNLAANLLDSFNTLMELYGGMKLGDDIYFSKEKVNQIIKQEQRFLFNDLCADFINPTNLLYETANKNTLLINNLTEETDKEVVNGSYIFKDILFKLQGFTAQALLPDESQRLIIDIPQELNNPNGNLAIAAIGSCYFWVVDKNKLAENQAVKLDLKQYIKLEVSHIPQNLVNEIDKYFYRSLITQALQQTQDTQAIVDFIDRCDINEYLQQDAAFKQHINQIISNKIALSSELKDQLIECVFYNGNYIENRQFKFSYANWFIESTLCEPLAKFFAKNSIDIIDFINQLSIKTLLQFENKLSLKHLCLAASEQATVAFDKKYFNTLFNKLMKYKNHSPLIKKIFYSGLIDLTFNDETVENILYILKDLIKNSDIEGVNFIIYLIQKSQIKNFDNCIKNIYNGNIFFTSDYIVKSGGKKTDLEIIFNLNKILLDENKLTESNLTRLCLAAADSNRVEILKYLISLENININAKNPNSMDALMTACAGGNLECVQILLESGKINTDISESFASACITGNLTCAKMLFDYNKNIDFNRPFDNGNNIFMLTCYSGNTECFKFLFKHVKINDIINKKNNDGFTALMYACKKNNTECIKFLLKHNTYLDINLLNNAGDSAFMIACKQGNAESVKILLDSGKIDTDISTLFASACTQGHLKFATMLFDYNKNINFNIIDDDGNNTLISACYYGKAKCLEFLFQHVKINDMINKKNKDGFTALMYACEKNNIACIKFLLKHHTYLDINLLNNSGDSAFMIACKQGSAESVKILLDSGKISAIPT